MAISITINTPCKRWRASLAPRANTERERRNRELVRNIGIEWYGWHGFRRGIASNLYELGANDKIIQRIRRHAKSHVTKDRYIKAFDPAVLAAMEKLEATLNAMSQSAPIVHQIS